MTREEFTIEYCSNCSIQEIIQILATNVVLPCDCEYPDCKGWTMTTVADFMLPKIKKLIHNGK